MSETLARARHGPAEARLARRTRVAVAAVGVLLCGLVGVSLAAPAQAQETESVMIMDYAFTPADLTIPVGTTVVWTNMDAAPHNVVSTDGGPLESETLQTNDTFSFTFTEPGTYEYFCSIHPDMIGTITVTEPSTEPPPTTGPPTTDPPGEEPECPPGGVVAAVLDPFWAHFQAAHLETSPLTQVQEAADVDQYVETHTVLLGNMLEPAYSTVSSSLGGLDPFWAHLQAAHLETSPLTQVQEAADVDQYVETHTVLLGNMLEPAVEPVTGSC